MNVSMLSQLEQHPPIAGFEDRTPQESYAQVQQHDEAEKESSDEELCESCSARGSDKLQLPIAEDSDMTCAHMRSPELAAAACRIDTEWQR